jgi:hypothetical protein
MAAPHFPSPSRSLGGREDASRDRQQLGLSSFGTTQAAFGNAAMSSGTASHSIR